jgi:hypothetical protein
MTYTMIAKSYAAALVRTIEHAPFPPEWLVNGGLTAYREMSKSPSECECVLRLKTHLDRLVCNGLLHQKNADDFLGASELCMDFARIIEDAFWEREFEIMNNLAHHLADSAKDARTDRRHGEDVDVEYYERLSARAEDDQYEAKCLRWGKIG